MGGTRGLPPENYEITFDQENDNEITYFINMGVDSVHRIKSKVKVALISDCRCIVPDYYRKLELLLDQGHFDHVVTYDDRLIQKYPEKVWIQPAGATFIWPEEKRKIYKKTKLCSYISSMKSITHSQVLRVMLLKYIYNFYHPLRDVEISPNINPSQLAQINALSSIDCYGTGHNELPDVLGKIDALADYAFSIAIENHESDHYFSEKVLDCFLSGTIPIYMGSKKINEYFNPDGIIFLSDLYKSDENGNILDDFLSEISWECSHGKQKQLTDKSPITYDSAFDNLIKSLSFEEYNKRIDAVKENFETAKKYIDSIDCSLKVNYEK